MILKSFNIDANVRLFAENNRLFALFSSRQLQLEGQTNGKMQALSITEMADVVETIFERHVQSHAPIDSQHEEVEVVAQTYARASSQLAQCVLQFKLASGTMDIFVQNPHVTSIEEHGSIELAKQPRPIF